MRAMGGAGALLVGVMLATGAAEAAPDAQAAAAMLKARVAPLLKSDGPGCVSAVAAAGRILATRTDGLANLELRVPLTLESAFDIGSNSKQFTALSAAILARRGQLDLDADIRTYLPDMHTFDPPIRVRDLIFHSSGLPDVYEPLDWLYGDPDGNLYPSRLTLQMARGITKLKFKPGAQFDYSNVGYLLLAEVIEKVSGQTLRKFAQANIFEPLGMTHTHFHDDFHEIVPNRASAYELAPDGKTWWWKHSDFTVMGDGGVYSTLGDIVRWQAFFADPSKIDGGRALLAMLETPGAYREKGPEFLGKKIDYGFGVQLIEGPPRRVGHTGSWAGYGSMAYFYPDSGFSIVALCNTRKAEVLKSLFSGGDDLASRVY